MKKILQLIVQCDNKAAAIKLDSTALFKDSNVNELI